jgi:peptidoglycan/xylan/chitin deacetylase (PgdA/CDA1 family)
MSETGFAWPNDARIAVVLTVLLENWSERNAPPFSPMTTALRPGTYDRAGVTWSHYAGRAGGWRLLRILDRHGLPATFLTNARTMELYPRLGEAILKSGHEVAAHGTTQDAILAYMTPAEERETIRRALDSIEKQLGKRPTGWLSPVLASTDYTAELIAEAGLLWYGDYNDIDLPCRVKTAKGTFVALPHTDFADHRVLRQAPRAWLDVFKDTFDYLYRNEPASYLNLTLHGNFGGRPLIAAMFDEVLTYMKAFPGVWFVRHDELARFVMEHQIDEWTYEQRFFS